ncbi:hypothetical protein [Rhodobacter capsulatus]|uniref:hypothetical protein n=1 Tax=Rhodobacter capsulatus TaxID=1061 RepID=UPI0040288ADC
MTKKFKLKPRRMFRADLQVPQSFIKFLDKRLYLTDDCGDYYVSHTQNRCGFRTRQTSDEPPLRGYSLCHRLVLKAQQKRRKRGQRGIGLMYNPRLVRQILDAKPVSEPLPADHWFSKMLDRLYANLGPAVKLFDERDAE